MPATSGDLAIRGGVTSTGSSLLYSLHWGFRRGRQIPPPNILWITSEDTSPLFGCYGDSQATTPAIDQLAAEGVVYTNAYASAPICAPARSCLISGMYATSLGTQHLRSDVAIPDFVRGLPAYLSDSGYFTFLYGKTDYNFGPAGMWDYREQELTPWRNRQAGQPFFGMYTIGNTHEGRVNIEANYEAAVADLPDSLFHDPAQAQLPPYFPDTPEFRDIWANYHDLISDFDLQVADIVQGLKDDGLYDRTIIFIFSDHGLGLPRYKRWLYRTGLQVPLIVRAPPQYQHLIGQPAGATTDELVSFVDFAPTVLQLANVPTPDYMEGLAFLGEHRALHGWMKEHHDTGLLLEPAMMIRAEGSTPYEMAHSPGAVRRGQGASRSRNDRCGR